MVKASGKREAGRHGVERAFREAQGAMRMVEHDDGGAVGCVEHGATGGRYLRRGYGHDGLQLRAQARLFRGRTPGKILDTKENNAGVDGRAWRCGHCGRKHAGIGRA